MATRVRNHLARETLLFTTWTVLYEFMYLFVIIYPTMAQAPTFVSFKLPFHVKAILHVTRDLPATSQVVPLKSRYPSTQEQIKEPTVFLHIWLQGPYGSAHSSTSAWNK